MKYLLHLGLLILIACSSAKDKKSGVRGSEVTKESFQKEKPLNANEVVDFYNISAKTASPALQDETLDRFTKEEVSDLSPHDPIADMAIKCSIGQFGEAFQTASQAFDKYQKVASYWNQVGNCHLMQGSQRKALLFYNKALEVSPQYAPTLNNIGVLYSRSGQDQKALVAFERANKKSKFSKTPRYNLAQLYLTYGLAEQALSIFRPLLEGSPQDADLLNSVASSYFLMSNYQEAWAHYKRIPSAMWSSPEIGLNLSLTLKKLGKDDDALKVFENLDRTKNTKLDRYQAVVGTQLGAKR